VPSCLRGDNSSSEEGGDIAVLFTIFCFTQKTTYAIFVFQEIHDCVAETLMPGDMKDRFKMIIKEFHESELPDVVERQGIMDWSVLESRLNKIVTLVGGRRAGKTYFLYQIMKIILKKKNITDLLYVNFEDERITPVRAEDLQSMMDAYAELYEGKTGPLVFLDEIQNVAGWDRFVRRLNDAGLRLFITGSNSQMLGREIASALRGRTVTYEVFPFSFGEFAALRGLALEKNLIYGKTRHKAVTLFEEYFFSGGYPEIALAESESLKGRILQDYFNTIFYKDLVDRYAIKNTELLRQWLNLLIMNVSSLVSFSKVENDFKSRGMKLSRATLSYFARYVEESFFGFFVEMYSESTRKRQVNPKKFYLIDPALHNFLTFKFSENKGRILENIVFLGLRRKNAAVFYYKTSGGQEVDFLLKDRNDFSLIQVCYDLHNVDVFTREKKALISAMRELGLKRGTMITMGEKRKLNEGGYTIEIVPAWEWLLRAKE
jgi:predicted AAA+ superfamily ATPase